MGGKKACIIVDLRTGEHVARVPDIVAVFSAAGWKTRVALKEYGGETLKLARQAAKDGYDLIIGYGGDGTLNATFNGVLSAGGKHSVADVPGGTFNVWAGAMGIPLDPVKAALTIVDSVERKIDLGHIAVEAVESTDDLHTLSKHRIMQKKPKQAPKSRQHFLFHVGIGFEAAMMAHISKPLKYRFGPLAFDLAMAKELPRLHPFPVELQEVDEDDNLTAHWQGNVWQVLVSKVPLFGGSISLEPGACADDGQLYIHLITANGALKTVEQALTMLTRHTLDPDATERFKGKHFTLRVPASINIQIDGSPIEPQDLLRKAEHYRFEQANLEEMMITYRFNARPRILRIAIPRNYNGPLFAKTSHHTHDEQHESAQHTPPQHDENKHVPSSLPKTTATQHITPSTRDQAPSTPSTYTVQVIGSVAYRDKRCVSIVAGRWKKAETNETLVVALRINEHTLVLDHEGQRLPTHAVLEWQEGQQIIVTGEKTKRSVIHTQCVRLEH